MYTNRQLFDMSALQVFDKLKQKELSEMAYVYFKSYVNRRMDFKDASDFEGSVSEDNPSDKDLYFMLESLELDGKDKNATISTELLSDILNLLEKKGNYNTDLYDEYESLLADQYDKIQEHGDGLLKLYIIKNGEGHVKIGITRGVLEKRLSSIQTGCSSRVELLKAFYCGDNTTLEKDLHKMFSKDRLTGEWFNESITEVVLSYCEFLQLDEV